MSFKRFFQSLGPAVIVASVVLGPGSILTSSRVGCEYGYQMLWVLVSASMLMICMTMLGAMIGIFSERTPCQEIAKTFGRPAAVVVGVVMFLIIACFQSSNNVAVIASLEGLMDTPTADETARADVPTNNGAKAAALLILNGVVVIVLYTTRRLYRPIEKLMMCLVLAMLAGFAINLIKARPSVFAALSGLAPNFPAEQTGGFFPSVAEGQVRDPLWALQGLVATTLSIAGAFYQAYLVRERKWTPENLKNGLVDSVAGIALLGCVTAMIMLTSAAAFYGNVSAAELASTSDVARQLEPLFGGKATTLFSLGIFAAAFSSFLGNALIGGTVLSDGLGKGSSMDDPWTRRLTVLALATGMAAALLSMLSGFSTVYLIVFAQALTVLGFPVLGVIMMWLGYRHKATVPTALLLVAGLTIIVTSAFAVRTAWRLYLQFSLA